MSEDQQSKTERPKPTSQQELNLALMDSVRHLAQYTVDVSALAHMVAGKEADRCREAGDHATADAIALQAEKTRKDGLRYHNSMVDVWEAFAKDSGALLTPKEPPARVKIDD